MPAEPQLLVAGVQVPQPERFVQAGREKLVLAGQESDAVDRLLVPLVAPQFLAAVHVPQSHCLVVAARKKTPAVTGERQAINDVGVAREAAQLLPGLQVPEADGGIMATGQGLAAIG